MRNFIFSVPFFTDIQLMLHCDIEQCRSLGVPSFEKKKKELFTSANPAVMLKYFLFSAGTDVVPGLIKGDSMCLQTSIIEIHNNNNSIHTNTSLFFFIIIYNVIRYKIIHANLRFFFATRIIQK